MWNGFCHQYGSKIGERWRNWNWIMDSGCNKEFESSLMVTKKLGRVLPGSQTPIEPLNMPERFFSMLRFENRGKLDVLWLEIDENP
jgi:hypothetical protein